MKRTKKDRQNERGSALLLVLGILSLVLIMGMSFVFTARTERQVAQANSSQMSAKLIAQSALNRVISDMGFYFFDDKNNNNKVDKGEVYPYPAVDLYDKNDNDEVIAFKLQDQADSDGLQLRAISKNVSVDSIDSTEQDFFNDILHLGIAGDSDNNTYEALPHLTMLSKVSGKETYAHPVTVKYKDVNDNKWYTDVIGRYGYVILEEGSKIDVNSALSFSEKVPFAPKEGKISSKDDNKFIVRDYSRIGSPYESEKDTDYVFAIAKDDDGDDEDIIENGTDDSSSEGKNTVRLGLSMEEIQLPSKFWNKLPKGSANVKKAPWMSYAHLSDALGKEDFAKECFNYTFFNGEDIEAFWDAEEKTERSRFDLTGFTASEKIEDTATYDARIDENFWELTSDENKDSEDSDLQENEKKKIDALIGADGSSKRAEFWQDIDEGIIYYDGKNGGFWYNLSDDGTITKETDTDKYGGIPWLEKMKDDNDKSVSEQVAANLIDYSDKDNIATTDFDVEVQGDSESGFSFKEPTYCGNERVPYINEIGLKVEMTRDATFTATGDTYDFKMNVKAMTELINIYCNDNGTGKCIPEHLHVEVRIIGELTVTEIKYAEVLNPDTGRMEQKPIEGGSKTKKYPMGGNVGYLALTSGEIPNFHLGYQVMELNGQAFPNETTNVDFPQPVNVNENGVDEVKYFFSYKINQVVALVYEGSTLKNDTLCDVAFFPKETYYELSESDAYSPISDVYPPTAPYILTMQVNDPRCNLLAKKIEGETADWNDNYWKIAAYDGSTAPEDTLDGENGKDNSNFEQKVAECEKEENKNTLDWEHDVKFVGSNKRSFSTAYIRNAPMQSLWELGAIHRGAPYQTINLKKFKDPNAPDDPAAPAGSTVGKYSGGDAAILDYVKIGPLRFAKGRVNANTRNLGAIDILLQDIPEDAEDYDGHKVTGDKVDYDLGAITNTDLMKVEKYPTSLNRGVMANLLNSLLTNNVKTDRDAEALIGKTAGLLTTRLDTYSVYIVAEALREMRDIPDDTTFDAIKDTLINPVKVKHVIRTDEDYNNSTTSYRTAGTKTSYCSIVGTQRMLVQLVRDAWRNEIKVERIQYLEK